MKLRNLWLAFHDQLPFSRFLRNLRKGHVLGLFHKRSHLTQTGTPKVSYGSKVSAQKAAAAMTAKRNIWFSNYKCLYCNGYHLGKNRENKG